MPPDGSDSVGEVRTLSGRAIGRTHSLEGTFVEEAAERAARGDVYAVVGPDSSEAFRDRVRAICPVLVEGYAVGVALLMDGVPSDWREAVADDV